MEFKQVRDDFRAFLQLEFSRRCKKNPQYSLRAYASSLDMDASSLSQFLRDKRNLSEAKLRSIALKLKLTEEEFLKFVADNSSDGFHKMASDHFMVLSEWYHIAICELCNLEDFQNNSKWIADRLGIERTEVKSAIDRLKRIGWVKEDRDNLSYLGGDLTTINSDISISALSSLQKQMLEKAAEAMDYYPENVRSQTGMTMSVSKDKVNQANAMITKFRRKLCQFLEDSEKKDDVYHLSISLFPLTKN